MAFLRITLITSLLAVAGAYCGHSYSQVKRDHEIAHLRKENAYLRLAISRRDPARPLTRDPEVQVDAVQAVSAPTQVGSDPMNHRRATVGETQRWPTRSYLNAGQATPVATLQTMAWACDEGDVTTMARLFIIDAEAGPQAEAIYSGIPAGLRAEWNSVEALAAAIMVHNGIEQPYPGSEVLALAKIEPIKEGRVALVLPGAVVSGLVFQHTAEGWKYVVSKAVVDDYIARRMTPTSNL
jgi:hypothetical protein